MRTPVVRVVKSPFVAKMLVRRAPEAPRVPVMVRLFAPRARFPATVSFSVGEAVPIPTLFVEKSYTNPDVSIVRPPAIVEVAVVEVARKFVIRNICSVPFIVFGVIQPCVVEVAVHGTEKIARTVCAPERIIPHKISPAPILKMRCFIFV